MGANDPAWAEPAGGAGGGWEYIATWNFSSGSDIDFINLSGNRHLKILGYVRSAG
jgi:hypothetical protein